MLWIVPVAEQLADDEIRPRQHERYFHSLYFGRTYYWWRGLGGSFVPENERKAVPECHLWLDRLSPWW